MRLRGNRLESLELDLPCGALVAVEELDLSYNALNGSLPTQIGQINNLEELLRIFQRSQFDLQFAYKNLLTALSNSYT